MRTHLFTLLKLLVNLRAEDSLVPLQLLHLTTRGGTQVGAQKGTSEAADTQDLRKELRSAVDPCQGADQVCWLPH